MAETYTSNLELVKPDYDSPADISVINSNMDKIDNAVANAGKVKSVNGKTGEVELGAYDVGALPSGGTAKNSTKLGGKDAKYYLQPRNLLDNSDFRNPVNQRGQTEYINNGYTIDRWELYAGAVGVSPLGYITTSGQLYQKIDIPTDKVYTFAIENDAGIAVVTGIPANGIHSATLGNALIKLATIGEYAEVVIEPSEGHNIVGAYWAALYEGEYTADNLPPYTSKGYAVELAECRRYYRKLSGLVARPYNVSASVRYYRVLLETPMRNNRNPDVEIGEPIETPLDSWNSTGATFAVLAPAPDNFTISASANASGSDFILRVDAIVSSDL